MNAYLIANNADGLFLAVEGESGYVFLGDYTGREDEAGRDFFHIVAENYSTEAVREWQEPEWLTEMQVEHPNMTKAQVRALAIDGGCGVAPLDHQGERVSMRTGAVARVGDVSSDNIRRALFAAGWMPDALTTALEEKMEPIVERAERLSSELAETKRSDTLQCSLLDLFWLSWGEFSRDADRVQEELGVRLGKRHAEHVASMADKLHRVVFGGGDISATFWREHSDPDGEYKDEWPCPPVEAERVELNTERIRFTMVGRGHYTQSAESLGTDIMDAIANMCSLGEATSFDWDGDNEYKSYCI